MQTRRHRTDTGRSFNGLTIHAAPGIHETALEIVRRHWEPGAKLLDVGAGSGAFTSRLLDCHYDVLALDLDTSQLPASFNAIQADINEDGMDAIAADSLDGVIALELIEHVHNPVRTASQFFRVLRPGGGLLLSTPNVLHPYSRLKFLIQGELWLFSPGAYWSTGHATPLPEWLLREHLVAVGFESIKTGFGGRLEVRGPMSMVSAALSHLPSRRTAELGMRDDGSTLFAYARKPLAHHA